MNGIKLKSNDINPIKVERIKWITLLFLSHILIFIINSSPQVKKEEAEIPAVKQGFVRLQIKINSQIPEKNKPQAVLLMSQHQKIISSDAMLIRKVISNNSLGTIQNEFLIEVPEKDLQKIISNKEEPLMAYPASKKISFHEKKKKENSYEINF